LITALDTNVISALWSSEATARIVEPKLLECRNEGVLVIAAPIYCELLAYPGLSETELMRFMADAGIEADYELDQPVWQEAGRHFANYAKRRRDSGGGQPRRLLIDFLIGAHAILRSDRLFTLDRDFYVRVFPKLRVI
jgi:predicted nucleic acid-binding protein